MQDRRTAIHEAGHAVVAHLTGTAIYHVAITYNGAGYSMPVERPERTAAGKLWKEALAISRKLRLAEVKDGMPVYVLRQGASRRLKDGTVRGTPAPRELVDRMNELRDRADATNDASSRDWIKDLMHTLGGPVADTVFFHAPFEAPGSRPLTRAELRARGLPETSYGQHGKYFGNHTAKSDFRAIKTGLRRMGYVDLKEAQEFYRHKVEKLVLQHKGTIERVANALLQHKKLSGAELAKLIDQKTMTDKAKMKAKRPATRTGR
jgi:hypothetical protein